MVYIQFNVMFHNRKILVTNIKYLLNNEKVILNRFLIDKNASATAVEANMSHNALFIVTGLVELIDSLKITLTAS